MSGPVDIGWSGCSSWRTVLAFTFINSFLFFCSAVLVNISSPDGRANLTLDTQGTAVILKYHGEKRHLRELAEQDAKTRKPPQAGPENLQVQSELPSMSRP